jgi:ankyrin repeat protein
MTPLSIACQKGEYTLVKYLIEKGAAINMIDKRNRRAIDYAIENNRQDIVELIDSYNSEKSEAESDLDAITRKLV